VASVLKLFERISEIFWQALPTGNNDDLGCHLSVVGTVEGQSVWLRVTAEWPEEFEPGRDALVYRNLRLEDR